VGPLARPPRVRLQLQPDHIGVWPDKRSANGNGNGNGSGTGEQPTVREENR
jgi:hypothetical protein